MPAGDDDIEAYHVQLLEGLRAASIESEHLLALAIRVARDADIPERTVLDATGLTRSQMFRLLQREGVSRGRYGHGTTEHDDE